MKGMKIVIIGVGKVGETLVKNLSNEKHDIVVVDCNSTALNKVVNKYDVLGVVGSGLEREVLENCQVDVADIIISCTSRDEMNILACVLAKKLGAKYTVARVRDPELFKEMSNIRNDLGIDVAFNPELRTANEIAQVLKFPSALNIESFAGGKAVMVEFLIAKGNELIGKSLIDVANYNFKVLFCAIKRGGEIIIPRGDFVLQENDCIHIIGTESEVASFCKTLKIFKPRAKSVFIIGGGKVSYYLSKELCAIGVNVKIVEKDKDRCVTLSQNLTGASILNADGTDQSVLDEENLKGADACVTLTGMDETNVILSLYAMQKNVGKVVTKIDRENVSDMVRSLGLGTVVSPKNVIANHILRFVRSREVLSSDGVKTLYKLNESVEALEFIITENCVKLGVPLKELKFKSGTIIGGIVRGDEFVLPVGDTEFMPNDRVIVVTSLKQINEFMDIFK